MTILQMNINQTAKAFNVSTMTVWHWRNGSAGRDPLPVVKTQHTTSKREHVTVAVTAAKAWAKKYNLPFEAPTRDDLVVKKAGPKPKPKPPAKSKRAVRKASPLGEH